VRLVFRGGSVPNFMKTGADRTGLAAQGRGASHRAQPASTTTARWSARSSRSWDPSARLPSGRRLRLRTQAQNDAVRQREPILARCAQNPVLVYRDVTRRSPPGCLVAASSGCGRARRGQGCGAATGPMPEEINRVLTNRIE